MKIPTYNAEALDRLNSPYMQMYKRIYKNSMHWDGETPLRCKRVIVYCEQGFGDIIQFSRYFHLLHDVELLLHCQKDLWRLFQNNFDVKEFIAKDGVVDILPPHDFHIRSMSLPFLFQGQEIPYPYLKADEITNLSDYKDYIKIGIAWEGNPDHHNDQRSFPLAAFKVLGNIKKAKLFMLQKTIHRTDLLKDTENLELLANSPFNDFYDTAILINSLDIVVSVDTAVLHLAGAMGKPTFGLLDSGHDPRWRVANWYPSVTLAKHQSDDYYEILDYVANQIDTSQVHKTTHLHDNQQDILITGGIGDFIALESHFPSPMRDNLRTVYLATRAWSPIKTLIESAYKQVECQVIWKDFSSFFAFYNKKEVREQVGRQELNWYSIHDWSISHRFPDIHYQHYPYNSSSYSAYELADLSRLNLPDRYAVIVSISENDRRLKDQEFSDQDFEQTFAFLEKHNLVGIVLGRGDVQPPEHPRLVSLYNQTSILESMEVVKRARCYIGIDSCLAVFAARHLPGKKVLIKCVNEHALEHRQIYFRDAMLDNAITELGLGALEA